MGKGARGEFPKEKKEKPKLSFFFLNRLKAANMTRRGNSRRRRRRRRCGSSPRYESTDGMDAGFSKSGVFIRALLADSGCDCAAVVLEWLKFARESSSRCLSFSPFCLLESAACITRCKKKRGGCRAVHPHLASRREFPCETS